MDLCVGWHAKMAMKDGLLLMADALLSVYACLLITNYNDSSNDERRPKSMCQAAWKTLT